MYFVPWKDVFLIVPSMSGTFAGQCWHGSRAENIQRSLECSSAVVECDLELWLSIY